MYKAELRVAGSSVQYEELRLTDATIFDCSDSVHPTNIVINTLCVLLNVSQISVVSPVCQGVVRGGVGGHGGGRVPVHGGQQRRASRDRAGVQETPGA